MSHYHNVHWVEFFPKSCFSTPVFMAVNCIMFDVLSHLTGPDTDLFFTTSHCFICHHALHRSESCPQRSLGTLFCKCLDDPHHTSSCFLAFAYWLMIEYRMGRSLSWFG
jgi:hypothetical protein